MDPAFGRLRLQSSASSSLLPRSTSRGLAPSAVVHGKCYEAQIRPVLDSELGKCEPRRCGCWRGRQRSTANQLTKLAALQQEPGSSLTGVTRGRWR